MAKKINHIKPSFIEGGEVWHDIDKFPMLDHTILVELQVKGSDGLIYRTQDVCVERADRFEPTMSFVPKRWAYAIDLAQCKKVEGQNKIQIKNKHMEESRGVYTLPVLYNEQSGTNEGVCVRKELGVVVAIDNEDEFKGVFSKDGEVDVFKQLLSQEVYRYYTEHNAFPTGPLVSYKMDGDIIFDYVEVTIGKMYGGYVYVVHYNFASTAS